MKWGILGIAGVGFLTACHSADKADSTTTSQNRSQSTYSSGRSKSADARILSILHAKNQEEIEIGMLATDKGESSAVRHFGEELISDHRDCDDKVRRTAAAANINLLSASETDRIMAQEKGMTTPPPSPVTELRSLQPGSFDKAFAQKMLDGHRELIRTLENSRPNLSDSRVRELVDQTLPTLRKHEKMATDLAAQ